jgi:hypothetical protein
MLATTDKTLKEAIVELLGEEANLTAEQIGARIARRERAFSRRAVFKELRSLEELGVLFKAKRRYHLQMIWIINMSAFLRGAYTAHLRNPPHTHLGALGAKTRINLTDLSSLDSAWMQIMFILQQLYPREQFRIWKPEQWFHLVHSNLTENFFVALGHIGSKHHHIIGHNCFVNRVGARMIPRSHARVTFLEDPLGVGMSTYITTIGEHVITIRINQSAAERMRTIFASIRNLKEMQALSVQEFMRGRIKSVLTVEHNPKKAREIQTRLDQAWGQ